jgi:peptidyl-prolyl cis-trans isomerase C
MLRCPRLVSLGLLIFVGVAAQAQQPDPPPPAPVPTNQPPDPKIVAATVNGQQIRELDIYRGMPGSAAARYKELRAEVLNFLIENALVDQYLDQMKVSADAKEVEAQVEKIKAELKERGLDLEKFCKNLLITEAELRTQLQATVRWDKFITQYANDKTLHDFFDANKAIFDGSQMRAKHILLTFPSGDAQKAEEAKGKILRFRKEIEEKVAKGLADAGKLDNFDLEKKRRVLLEEAFAAVAARESACPSKTGGGDLGWFPRVGSKAAEPFARAAFALKPYEMSDAVQSELGYHLILALDTKPGLERKYEDIREAVKDVYGDRMREAIVVRMRQSARIEVAPAPK